MHAGGPAPALQVGSASAMELSRRRWVARINELSPLEAMPLMSGMVRLFGPVLDEPNAWVDLTDDRGGVFMAVEMLWTDVMDDDWAMADGVEV